MLKLRNFSVQGLSNAYRSMHEQNDANKLKTSSTNIAKWVFKQESNPKREQAYSNYMRKAIHGEPDEGYNGNEDFVSNRKPYCCCKYHKKLYSQDIVKNSDIDNKMSNYPDVYRPICLSCFKYVILRKIDIVEEVDDNDFSNCYK
jgi:hypothetical protein